MRFHIRIYNSKNLIKLDRHVMYRTKNNSKLIAIRWIYRLISKRLIKPIGFNQDFRIHRFKY